MPKRTRAFRKNPLHRKVNSLARGVHHDFGGEHRWSRHCKQDASEVSGSMHVGVRRGRDYTPLFRFLLSHVGDDWDAVYSEAVSRLDRIDPIFWLVARPEADKMPVVRCGDNAYYSGLFVEENGKLALVDPELTIEQMVPRCTCCTHTFNGTPFTRKCPL